MKFKCIDINGKETGSEEIKFDSSKRSAIDHELYLTIQQQGKNGRLVSASTKTRSDVRGGGRKPYAQKGTGNARRGTNRTPLRVGGGVIFGPSPRIRKYKLGSKSIRSAIKYVLSFKESQIVILDIGSDNDIKTKQVTNLIQSVSKESPNKVSFVVSPTDHNGFSKAFRNVANHYLLSPNFMDLSKLISSELIIFTVDSFTKVKELVNHD